MTRLGTYVRAFGRSDVGAVRKNNEDAFVIADLMVSAPIHSMSKPIELAVGTRGVLLAVSDGMGGAQAGEVASALTLHCLRTEMPAGEGGTADAALAASVETANRRVWDAATDSNREGMGATLTAVLVHNNRAYVAEVGDSRAYLLRGSRLVQLTLDQSYAQMLVDSGALTQEQSKTFEHKNVVLQAIGTKPSVVVALNRFTLRRADRILLCSDGLSGKVTDEELRGILITTAKLDVACKQLVDLAIAHGGDDNITIVLAQMDGEGLPVLTGEERVSLETVQSFPG